MADGAPQTTRSCVGCREPDERSALLRLILVPSPDQAQAPGLLPDVRKRGPGRGVSVHPRFRCLQSAVQSGAFKRAFKAPVQASASELAHVARVQYERRAEGLLLAARRAHKLALGTEAVRDAIQDRRAKLLIIAGDAEGSREELQQAALRLGRSCLVWNTKIGLGHLFSRATLSILAVLDHGIADELQSVVGSVAGLAEDA
ncbi:MAG TPA: DUF448 domain-containing protein [Polyangiales bacterium]|nr:DUF448 domain-containing protein [Polyangiales bacterium]